MLTYPRWKYALALLVLVASVLYSLPNLYPQDPSVQITANRGAKIDQALHTQVAGMLASAGVKPKSISVDRDGNLLVRLNDADQQTRASDALGPALGNNYVVALNLASTVPGWLSSLGAKPMLLGLDLQGGVHFEMQVDRDAAIAKKVEAYLEDIRGVLRDKRIRYLSVDRSSATTMRVQLADAGQSEQALALLQQNMPNLQPQANGATITLGLSPADLASITSDAIEQNIGVLRKRVNELGVAEPVIQRQGSDRIVVELPGVQDTAQAKRVLGATATLEYRGVVQGDAAAALATGNVPPDARIYYRREVGPDGKPIPILLNKRVIATGDQLVDARSGIDPRGGTPEVSVRLNSVGGQRMFDYTSQHVGQPMAVVYIERIPEVTMVNGREVRSSRVVEQVINAATIQGVFGKEFQTTGLDSPKEAADLALLLRAGALAAPMDFVQQQVVGPSLGKENIDNGLRAVGFSFLFALVFFLVYYRLFGVITVLALLLNLLAVVAIMSVLGATLTLPGLAGIALTVGMSVDANVLINERIREDLRLGMPPLTAISEGYRRATGTIADANMTTILAGLALFAFGTGPVKGFAITLIIGILTSMYTAVSVSRGIATLVYGRRRKLASIAI
jgi:preprotein translocase subunit SecD